MMRKNNWLPLILILILISGCSVEISGATPAKAATARATAAPNVAATAAPPTPLAWADLKINGTLIYTQGLNGVLKLDLATGKSTTLFKPPKDAWLRDAAASPDRKTLLISYAPPPPAGEPQFGYTDLYVMPIAGGDLKEIIKRTDSQESFFHPTWSPDGKFIYYAHFTPIDNPNGQRTFKYAVERIAYPNGKAEVLIENAVWPRLSRDGKRLAYLSIDSKTFSNELFLGDADGKNSKAVMKPETFTAVDAHFFSPDDSAIIFSAVGEGKTSSLTWIDRLLGVGQASAHDVPSDWWKLDLKTGKIERLTRIYDVGLYGGFSPDGKHIGFIAVSGVYVMKADGNNLTPITTVSAVGTLEWTP